MVLSMMNGGMGILRSIGWRGGRRVVMKRGRVVRRSRSGRITI